MRFDGIVLAGGSATRLGGVDKALVEAGGKPFLERAIEALADARRTIVVGPPREVTAPSLLWVEESPAGGGPAAALGAGLSRDAFATYLPAFYTAGAACMLAAIAVLMIRQDRPSGSAAAPVAPNLARA